MSRRLHLKDFNWVEGFITIYNADSNIGHFIEVDVPYSEHLPKLHSDLTLLPEKMKIKKKKKIVASFYDKEEYVIHIRDSKQSLNHGLVLKKCMKLLNLIKKLG